MRFAIGRNDSFACICYTLFLFLSQLTSNLLLFLQRVVIACKKLLKLWLAQKKRIFFDELCLFFIFNCDLFVLIEMALFHHGNKRRLNILAAKFLPVESLKPRMILNLRYASTSQPCLGFTFYQLVDEICSLKTPFLGDISGTKLNFFGEH